MPVAVSGSTKYLTQIMDKEMSEVPYTPEMQSISACAHPGLHMVRALNISCKQSGSSALSITGVI